MDSPSQFFGCCDWLCQAVKCRQTWASGAPRVWSPSTRSRSIWPPPPIIRKRLSKQTKNRCNFPYSYCGFSKQIMPFFLTWKTIVINHRFASPCKRLPLVPPYPLAIVIFSPLTSQHLVSDKLNDARYTMKRAYKSCNAAYQYAILRKSIRYSRASSN